MFVPGGQDVPPNARRLVDAVADACGMLWSSPLYHGGISGAFKNALDWLDLLGQQDPPYLSDKIIGLIATAGGTHGLQAINSMEFIVRSLRGWAVPLVIPVSHARSSFDAQGDPQDPAVRQQLQALGQEVVRAAVRFADDGVMEYAEAVSNLLD